MAVELYSAIKWCLFKNCMTATTLSSSGSHESWVIHSISIDEGFRSNFSLPSERRRRSGRQVWKSDWICSSWKTTTGQKVEAENAAGHDSDMSRCWTSKKVECALQRHATQCHVVSIECQLPQVNRGRQKPALFKPLSRVEINSIIPHISRMWSKSSMTKIWVCASLARSSQKWLGSPHLLSFSFFPLSAGIYTLHRLSSTIPDPDFFLSKKKKISPSIKTLICQGVWYSLPSAADS